MKYYNLLNAENYKIASNLYGNHIAIFNEVVRTAFNSIYNDSEFIKDILKEMAAKTQSPVSKVIRYVKTLKEESWVDSFEELAFDKAVKILNNEKFQETVCDSHRRTFLMVK